ncbi:MAG: hypothetical protein LBL67_01690 [Coriobacteriales bacterium]|jgi:hypothetical protein|nr:hypothetical protein [Coriobacteriales bacterium]
MAEKHETELRDDELDQVAGGDENSDILAQLEHQERLNKLRQERNDPSNPVSQYKEYLEQDPDYQRAQYSKTHPQVNRVFF